MPLLRQIWRYINEFIQGTCITIIVQAVKDYRDAVERLRYTPDDKSAQHDKRSIEKFFRSNWFSILSDLNGELLLKKLKEEVSE